MKKFTLILTLTIFMLLLPTIQAEIFLSQPKNIYNLGETLNISIKLIGPLEGILKTEIVCKEKQLFYADYINLEKEITLNKQLKLKKDKGTCYISAQINEQETKTSSFKVSDKINLEFSLNKEYFLPQDEIEIKGTAIKESAENAEGAIEIYLGGIFLKQGEIKNGNFNEKLSLPKPEAYEYDLTIKAYDKEKLNFGEATKKIYIVSIPSSLKLDINEPKPGTDLIISVSLYDQNNKEMKENLSVIINSPTKEGLYKKQVISGQDISFQLPSNAEFGDWKVKAFYDNLESEKHFYIDRNEQISLTMEGNILTARNLGNVPYKKIITIEIFGKDEKFLQEVMVELDIDEKKEINFEAPEGEYNIKIGNETFTDVKLTGKTVDINKFLQNPIAKNPIWIILILIVIFLIFIIYQIRQKKNQGNKENI